MAILDAAEREIAVHGLDVPLRDIAKAAGNRNNSAVHYFFGSRAGLIAAILQRRTDALEATRMSMLADYELLGASNDLRGLVEMLVRPIVDIARRGEGSHYGRFLDVARAHPAVVASARLHEDGSAAVRIIVTRLEAGLDDLEPARRPLRLRSMATAMFGLIADHEEACEHDTAPPGAVDDIIDMLTGLITANLNPRLEDRATMGSAGA